jgi:hypothetical protein
LELKLGKKKRKISKMAYGTKRPKGYGNKGKGRKK